MRIVNPNNSTTPFYAGVCKSNTAPKHLEKDGVTKVKATLDKTPITMYDSPKSKDYVYIQVGDNWMWVKDKSIIGLKKLETTKIVRESKIEQVEENKES